MSDKILVKVDMFYMDSQFAKLWVTDTSSPTGKKVEASELKGIVDANLGLEYRFSKKLGFFFSFNNIANYQYYRWSNYPTQRSSIMGGLSYSF